VTIGIVTARPRRTDILLRTVALRPEHQVLWIATSGPDAVARCANGRPDLILLDLLPGIEGVHATRRIMASAPCAILIVTESVHVNAARVFEAMGCGALDVVEMPAPGTGTLQESAEPLLAKLAVISLLLGGKDVTRRTSVSSTLATQPILQHPLVAIGASAGGPAALAVVLGGLPGDFPAAIVVVQHVEEKFAAGMANWLSEHSALPVMLAKEGECPSVGRVLLAGTNDHLMLAAAGRLVYTPEPRDYVYRPSVDVFFESLSRLWRGTAIGVLLTGMGRDGALGLKALRDRGHHTIAQDRASCAVYGMPKAAASLNAAVEILPMAGIASRLMDLVRKAA
jgi:two-component system response regulator WspF